MDAAAWRARLPVLLGDDALAQALLGSLSVDELAMQWARSVLNPPVQGQRVLVAVEPDGDGERIVGYAAIGPSQEADSSSTDPDPFEYELAALEVDPAGQRSGHGSRLMAAAMDVARESGAASALTWCALDDAVRRAFFQDAGWAPDSAFRDLAISEGALLREVRLVTALEDQDT